jgi:hypothetical protein
MEFQATSRVARHSARSLPSRVDGEVSLCHAIRPWWVIDSIRLKRPGLLPGLLCETRNETQAAFERSRHWLPVVPPPSDSAAESAQDPEDGTDHNQDDADAPEDGDVDDGSQNQQEDA